MAKQLPTLQDQVNNLIEILGENAVCAYAGPNYAVVKAEFGEIALVGPTVPGWRRTNASTIAYYKLIREKMALAMKLGLE